MRNWKRASVSLCAVPWMNSTRAQAQQDPGPRPGPAAAGGPYPTLDANQELLFDQALARFQAVDSVSGRFSAPACSTRQNLRGVLS
jgi:hypothetical protein